MGLMYQETVQIKGYDVDKTGTIHVHRLIGLLLYISGEQTKRVQSSNFNKDYLWFILQHDMTIHRLPRIHEEVSIETEATSYNTFFTYRRFRVYCQGELLVETMMKFAVVDKTERKLAKIEEWMVSAYQAEESKKIQKFDKIRLPEEFESYHMYRVCYSDIDVNQHVNNAVYVRWIMDSVAGNYLDTHTPSRISIVYEHEVLLGEEVVEKHQFDNETSYHVIEKGEDIAVKAKIEWGKI